MLTRHNSPIHDHIFPLLLFTEDKCIYIYYEHVSTCILYAYCHARAFHSCMLPLQILIFVKCIFRLVIIMYIAKQYDYSPEIKNHQRLHFGCKLVYYVSSLSSFLLFVCDIFSHFSFCFKWIFAVLTNDNNHL